MNNEQKKDEGRAEPQTNVRPKDDPLTPKRNKKGTLDRFARRAEEVAKAEKARTRTR